MLNRIIEKSAKFVLESPAAFLRWTTAGIFVISTLAHSGGLYINSRIPKEKKNYMIGQELLNGVLELVTFMTIATGLENLGRNLVDKGTIVAAETVKNSPAFRKGVAMFFSLAGTVLAFNLVTPLLRNPMLHYIQKYTGFGVTPKEDPEQLTRPMLPALNIKEGIDRTPVNNPFMQFESRMTPETMSRINLYRQTTYTSGAGMRI